MTCVRCEVADAERASQVTGFAYVYTAAGFRPMAPGSDPFADAPLAGDEHLQPHGTRAAYVRHKRRGEQPCSSCRAALRRHSLDNYYRRKANAASSTSGSDVLCTPGGSPILVTVSGGHEALSGDGASKTQNDVGPDTESLTA